MEKHHYVLLTSIIVVFFGIVAFGIFTLVQNNSSDSNVEGVPTPGAAFSYGSPILESSCSSDNECNTFYGAGSYCYSGICYLSIGASGLNLSGDDDSGNG